MTIGDNPRRTPGRWRVLVLGIAATAAMAIAVGSDNAGSGIAADAWAADAVRFQRAAETKPEPVVPAEKPSKAQSGVDAEISIGEGGVTIRKGGRESRRADREHDDFESFEQFVEQAPWIASLVFGVTGLLLLFPLLVIVLVVWYKMRSTRMRNETMLKLAERGVVPPGEAMAAVAATSGAAAVEASPSTAPLYEQAKRVRKRAAWSDLRKGVILGGIGGGLSLWSIIEHGTANAIGLVLLFVGIGYIVLWYFEDRHVATPRDGGPSGGPGA